MSARVEWGIRYSDSRLIRPVANEADARAEADGHNKIDKSEWSNPFLIEVVSRTVTDWEKA